MILSQKQTTLAYRCPSCGGVPTGLVGIFSLSGNMFRLKCSCKGSALTLEKTRDNKLRLTTPCLVCAAPHTYTISQNVFFGSDIFLIPCNLSGIDICFIGKPDNVSSAISASNEEIIKMLGDSSIERLKNQSSSKPFLSDPQVLDIVTYVVRELNDEGKIYCKCENRGIYECNIYEDYITVKCKKCGASATIPADSTIKAHEFLNTDSLTLE